MAAILGEKFLFGFLEYTDTLWVKNFDEIALSRTVKELAKFCVLPFLRKNLKFKMAAIFGKKIFFWYFRFLKIPCGSKISTKSLYLAPLRS